MDEEGGLARPGNRDRADRLGLIQRPPRDHGADQFLEGLVAISADGR